MYFKRLIKRFLLSDREKYKFTYLPLKRLKWHAFRGMRYVRELSGYDQKKSNVDFKEEE